MAVLLSAQTVHAQDATGTWNGVLKVETVQLRVVFHISRSGNTYSATMDSPDQGAKGIPLTNTSIDGSKVMLSIPSANISYEGVIKDGNTMEGKFVQGARSIDLVLVKEKADMIASADAAMNAEDLVLHTRTGDISGTLNTPKQFSRGPVVLFIAGSGPTDRDGNQAELETNAYKKTASELAKNNIATLRYDKRGVSASIPAIGAEADMRFEDYVNDAGEWIALLKKDKRFSEVVVAGHSEGSLVGMIAAKDAAKFISIAGAGRPLDMVLKEQMSVMPQDVKTVFYSLIDSLKQGYAVHNPQPQLEPLLRSSVQPYLISLFKYHPQEEIKKLRIPVLIVQGTSDMQVSVTDAELLAKAKPDAQLKLISGMNHVLKIVKDQGENMRSYSDPSFPVAPELVETLVKFILGR